MNYNLEVIPRIRQCSLWLSNRYRFHISISGRSYWLCSQASYLCPVEDRISPASFFLSVLGRAQAAESGVGTSGIVPGPFLFCCCSL